MRFSVVSICYNAEKEISDTMKSVLAQTYCGDMEYIIVDGASGDKTVEIARSMAPEFAAKGIPFRCYSAPDKGISDAFNKGIGYAQGEIVALVNAGDHLRPDALEVLNAAYDEHIDIYYGNIIWSDKENGLSYIKKSRATPNDLPLTMSIMHPACFIRKSAYEMVGMYRIDFRYSMDRELLARMFMAGRQFRFIDHVFSEMAAGGLSDSSAFNAERKRESLTIAQNCGISRIRFEWVFQRAKYRYKIQKWIKENTALYPLLLKLKRK